MGEKKTQEAAFCN